jgi:small-conductance mechanosensitive channel
VRGGLQKRLESWLEALRKVGFLILLLAGSAVFGFAIAWPLWLFATSQRQAYTIFAFCVAGGGLLALAVRRFIRHRASARDPGRPRRTVLSVILTILLTIVALAGGYVAAVLLYRGMWILAVPALAVWVVLLWALGFARRASKRHKEGLNPAENGSE